ncbi:MAG: Ig-like domain-containing protein [Clostridia bacterium]|nr:Ig-like domain-containing protein [Clostridia bacterium]
MKFFKKQISLIAAISMLATTLAVTTAGAATPKLMPNDYSAWDNKVNVNFDDYADLEAAKADGLKIQAEESCIAIQETEKGNSIGLLNSTTKSSGVYYTLDEAATSGQVKMTFSAKTETLCTQPIYIFADASTPTVGQEVITFSKNLDTLVFNNTNTGKQFIKGEWIDVTILADFDTDTLKTTFFGPGMKVLYSRVDALSVDAVAGILFRSWWQATGDDTTYAYFDNIKIATRSKLKTSTSFAKEDFETLDYAHELFADNWDAVAGSGLIGPTEAEIVDGGTGYGKALLFKQANNGFKRAILTKNGEAFSKGLLKIDFSISSEDATKTKIFACVGDGTTEQQIIYFAPNLIQKDSGTAANSKKYETDTWYDVSVIINLAESNYTVQVTSGGNLVDEFSNSLNSNIETINTFRIHKWDAPEFMFDNFCVAEYEAPKPSANILTEDFEGTKTLTERGWESCSASSIISIDTADGNKGKLEINEEAGTNGGMKKTFSQVTEGKIRTVFTVDTNNNKFYVKLLTKNNSNNDATIDCIYITGQTDGKLVLPGTGAAYGDNLSTNYTLGTVYKIENIYDLDSDTRTLNLYDATTDQLIKTKEYSATGTSNADKQLANVSAVTGIEVMNWGYGVKGNTDNPRGSNPAYIDNIVVEYVVDKPVLSASSVQFIDYAGNVVADKTAMTTALDKIVLDFGCNVDETTIEDAVTIETKNGTPVPFTASFDAANRIYTIIPDNYLTSSTEYVLNVANTVENKFGYAMDNAFEVGFKTAENTVVIGEIDSVKANNINDITKVSDIYANQKINLTGTFVNSSNESKTLTFVIAYYSGKKLVNIEACGNAPLAANDKSPISAEFTAPADMTGIDSVSIYLWDTLLNIMPYAPAKVIGNN